MAEEKNTSLYQATELLKISRDPFVFVCETLKRSFALSDSYLQRLREFDAQFKKMIDHRRSDDGEDTQDDHQLTDCLETLSECAFASRHMICTYFLSSGPYPKEIPDIVNKAIKLDTELPLSMPATLT